MTGATKGTTIHLCAEGDVLLCEREIEVEVDPAFTVTVCSSCLDMLAQWTRRRLAKLHGVLSSDVDRELMQSWPIDAVKRIDALEMSLAASLAAAKMEADALEKQREANAVLAKTIAGWERNDAQQRAALDALSARLDWLRSVVRPAIAVIDAHGGPRSAELEAENALLRAVRAFERSGEKP